jgi:hypothetical protein
VVCEACKECRKPAGEHDTPRFTGYVTVLVLLKD